MVLHVWLPVLMCLFFSFFLLSDKAIIAAKSMTWCRKRGLKVQTCCHSLNYTPLLNLPLPPIYTYAYTKVQDVHEQKILGYFAVCSGRLCLEAGSAQRKCLGSALCQLQPLVWITCGRHDDERASGARWSVYDRKALLHVTNQAWRW